MKACFEIREQVFIDTLKLRQITNDLVENCIRNDRPTQRLISQLNCTTKLLPTKYQQLTHVTSTNEENFCKYLNIFKKNAEAASQGDSGLRGTKTTTCNPVIMFPG